MDSEQNSQSDSLYADEYSTAPPWDDKISTIMAIGFASLLIVMGVVFWAVIPFALTTTVIAYLLNPITDFFQKRVTFGRRGWAVFLTFLLILIVIVLVFILLLPPLVEQSINGVVSLWDILVEFVTQPIVISSDDLPFVDGEISLFNHPDNPEIPISIRDHLEILLNEMDFSTESILQTSQELSIDRETLQQFFSIGGGVTSSLVGSIFSIAGSTVSLVLNTLFFLTILATLLGGGRSITDKIVDTVPDGYESDSERLLTDLGNVWNSYVRGNFTLGVVMGFAMWLIAIVLGLPNPLFLAFVAFAMEFIPNLGPVIAMVIAGAMALAGGSSTFPEMGNLTVTGLMVIAWFVMQQLEAIVLVPRIVGDSLKLHPAIVILSVIWGGSFGGIIGVVIAPPLVASIRIIMHYIYGRLTERTAFIEREPNPESAIERMTGVIAWLGNKIRRPKRKQSS
ncbi:MAG: AI-2E family transporter [Anaerolineae bacterium]|nr:AI-2E family transporter [Anaerolineae bacterium]MDQ7034866.1 AI-2E family transporter [Anaerolineae bacterium]